MVADAIGVDGSRRAIDDSLGEPWCGVLAKHLEGHREGRRFASASHVTELFRSYAAQRPQMLIDWAAGRLTDGHGLALSEDFEWQARLWCIVADKIDVAGPAERLGQVSRALVEDPALVTYRNVCRSSVRPDCRSISE